MTRFLDIIFSLMGLLILLPLLLLIALIIVLSSRGGVFYRQVRVGKGNKDFRIYKFRTMHVNADKQGLITVGGRDPRITKVGYYLRKYKLDELPQLINVLKGEMSFVGPRPEVRKYVELYTEEQQRVLSVKPGITDLASIEFRNENELLEQQTDPNKYYIETIMPKKIEINMEYIRKQSITMYFNIIFSTIKAIL